MKKTIQFIFLLLTISASAQKNTKVQGQSVELGEVLENVKKALEEVENSTELPGVANVNVTFQTEVSRSTETGLKILFFKFGKKWERSQSNEMSFNFKLKQKGNIKEFASLQSQLAEKIRESIDQIKSLDNSFFTLNDYSIKLSFVLSSQVDASGEYEIIPIPITPSLGRSWKKKAVHSIQIDFRISGKNDEVGLLKNYVSIQDSNGKIRLKLKHNGNIYFEDEHVATLNKSNGKIIDPRGDLIAAFDFATDELNDKDGELLVKINQRGEMDNGSGVIYSWSDRYRFISGNQVQEDIILTEPDKEKLQLASILLYLYLG